MTQAHQPTKESRAQVEAMAAVGVSVLQIAGELGISQPTLRLHYTRELERATSVMCANVGQRLYKAAMAGNVRAMITILKCRGGWRETDDELGELGKKKLQELLGKVAGKGTEWDELLTPGGKDKS